MAELTNFMAAVHNQSDLEAPAEIAEAPAGITVEKTIPERIEALIARTGISYYDLAKAMEVTRTTVHAVRKGQREPTKKFVSKFELAEKRILAARLGGGVLTPRTQTLLIFAASTTVPEDEIMGSPDRLEVSRIGTAAEPNPKPVELRLSAPRKDVGMGAIIRALTHEECDGLIQVCVPENYAGSSFIQSISPKSYLLLLKKCAQLVLGANWRQELQDLAAEVEERRRMVNAIVNKFPLKPEAGKE